jgi:hypothetical protein
MEANFWNTTLGPASMTTRKPIVRLSMTLFAAVVLTGATGCASRPPIGGAASRAPASHPSVATLIEGVRPGDRVLLVFGAVDCPIANAYAPELAALFARVSELGWRMLYVYADPHLDEASVTAGPSASRCPSASTGTIDS